MTTTSQNATTSRRRLGYADWGHGTVVGPGWSTPMTGYQ
jgi:hypothetical protein